MSNAVTPEMIRLLNSGDQRELRAFLTLYAKPVYDRAMAITGNETDARRVTRRVVSETALLAVKGALEEDVDAQLMKLTDACCSEDLFFAKLVDETMQELAVQPAREPDRLLPRPPVVAPKAAEPLQKPAEPAYAFAAPAPKVAEPAAKPAEPAYAFAAPVPKVAEPAAKPAEPAYMFAAPAPKAAEPAAKIAEPAHAFAAPVPKAAEPAAKIAEPAPKPAAAAQPEAKPAPAPKKAALVLDEEALPDEPAPGGRGASELPRPVYMSDLAPTDEEDVPDLFAEEEVELEGKKVSPLMVVLIFTLSLVTVALVWVLLVKLMYIGAIPKFDFGFAEWFNAHMFKLY